MNGKTRSFTLYEAASRMIDERAAATSLGHSMLKGSKNYSRVVDSALERYELLVRKNLPKLEVGEWRVVLEAIGGVRFETSLIGSSVDMVVEFIDCACEEADEKDFAVDLESFKAKLKRLNLAKRIALVDQVEKIWAALARGEKPLVPGE